LTDNNENKDNLLTSEEVWDMIKFAQGLSYPQIYTPDLVNSRMKEISMNPLNATQDQLDKALLNPRDSELELLGFSEDFELVSQPYKRLISYLANMLSFDITYTCTNATIKDYKTKAYQKDVDEVNRFLDIFDFKKEFKTATREMTRNEAFFCSPRFGNRIILQELPSSPMYTKITGRWDYGILFSINMYWFLQPGVVLELYDDFFKEKYNKFYVKAGNTGYTPYVTPEMRGSSSWVYWQDIPVTVGWCFKMSPEIVSRVPYFSPLFSDLILQPLTRNLQKNINMAAAARLIIGEIGTLKDAGAKVKDQFNINPTLLGQFLSLIKSAISEAIKVTSAPLNNVQGISFPTENELYDSYLRTTLASSGVNTNLLFTSQVRPNTIETQLSLNTDEQLMELLYSQFNAFMNYHVNRVTKNFKFEFVFEGTEFYNNRQRRLDTQMTLTDKGIVMPQKIAAAIGMKPNAFMKQLEEARALGFTDNLTPIVPAFQMSGAGGKEGGRPQKKDSELGDNGEQTRASGSNLEKGGTV
jgi:hypothetical protein